MIPYERPEYLPNLVAGLLLAGLGLAAFAANPGRSVNRSFAMVAFFSGLGEFLFGLGQDAGHFVSLSNYYVNIVIPFAAIFLTFQMVLCYKAARVANWMRNTLLFGLCATCLLFVWLFIDQRELFLVRDPVTTYYSSGPLDLFTELKYLTFAVLSLTFATMTRGTKLGIARRSLAQAAVAFAIMPTYLFAFLPGQFFVAALIGVGDWSTLVEPAVLLLLAIGPTVVAATVVLFRQRHPETVAWGRRYAWVAAAAFLTGSANALPSSTSPSPSGIRRTSSRSACGICAWARCSPRLCYATACWMSTSKSSGRCNGAC